MKKLFPLCISAVLLFSLSGKVAAESSPASGELPWSIRLTMFITTIDFSLMNNPNGMPDLTFMPDTGKEMDAEDPETEQYLGIHVQYRDFGISFNFAPGLVSLHNFDSTASYAVGHIASQAYFRNYSGFRLADRLEMGLSPAEQDRYGIRRDLRIRNIGLNLYYLFSDDFVFYGALNPNSVQQESGGSWMIKMSPYLVMIRSDYPLVPESFRSAAPNNAGFTGGNYWGLTVMGGYGYSLVYEGFYLTPALFIGGGIQYQDAGSEGRKRAVMPVWDFDYSIAIGYEVNNFFFGMWFVDENTFIKLKDFNIQMAGVSMETFAGRRF